MPCSSSDNVSLTSDAILNGQVLDLFKKSIKCAKTTMQLNILGSASLPPLLSTVAFRGTRRFFVRYGNFVDSLRSHSRP